MMSLGLRVTLALAALGTSFAVGCSKDETTTINTGYPYPDEASFCDALGQTVCNAQVVDDCAVSEATCRATFSDESNCNPNNYDYHPADAEACLAKIYEIYADATISSTEREEMREACLTVFADGGGDGASCQSDQECDTPNGLRCVTRPGVEYGTCHVPVEVAGGGSCLASDTMCTDGYYCHATVNACVEEKVLNATCSDTEPCNDQGLCSGTLDGLCQEKLPDGALTCTSDNMCLTGFCDKVEGAGEEDTGKCTTSAKMGTHTQYCLRFP